MPPSIGVNLRVTGHCSQGGRKYMEDLFSVAYQQTEDERDLEYAFFGIYDGHGGSEAAAFAKEHLMDSIVKQRQFWSDNDEDVLKAIRNGYMLTHLNMWKELEKWPKTVTGLPSTAGTTASVAFIRRGKIYIGHVGDSAIVLGYQKEGCEDWAAKPLTSDHKPESSAEIERIQRCGGKVITKAGVPRVVWNRPRLGHKGPIKKNTPMDEIPFLAVARSLGDLWSYNPQNDEFIVSPDPDVGVLTIDPAKFRCLIFGTDGLWNMMSAEGAVALVQATERHNEAALLGAAGPPRDWLNPSKSLVDHALERWSNTRMRADNTSVVTLMLDPPGPPRATVLRSRTGAAHRPHLAAPSLAHPQGSPPPHPPPASASAAPAAPATSDAPATPATPPNGDGDSRQVPQNGLTIMTRYSEVDKPASTPDAADKTPLPPCATLDGRFSIPSREETPREDVEDAITNYGNPAESYFMARLLNRSRVVNTLSEVYEEIVNRQTSDRSEAPEAPPATALPEAAGDAAPPASDHRVDAVPEPPPATTSPTSPNSPVRPEPDGGIQIPEASSSSSQFASGNCARAPGPARRAAAARGAHYKENLCGRTRARTAPAPRQRARRAPSDEVHSTTGWARALRSRNDGEPHAAVGPQPPSSAPTAPPAKRARCEAVTPAAASAGKRAGPWPTLTLRNRLRRRLAK
ncbi:Protein phosphatase 1D [Papilio machaon]|uniref:Protein phosphatase 1D n=1 Tax=Papilio machaon TaxID=76193 RepID=A0A0N0PC67_PAPMA|nr:Protein phosphatase 1D [Papilio machaon]